MTQAEQAFEETKNAIRNYYRIAKQEGLTIEEVSDNLGDFIFSLDDTQAENENIDFNGLDDDELLGSNFDDLRD